MPNGLLVGALPRARLPNHWRFCQCDHCHPNEISLVRVKGDAISPDRLKAGVQVIRDELK